MIYVRVGARSTLDSDSAYVYSTVDGGNYTDPVSRSYTLPASLTPGGGIHDGSARSHAVTAADMAKQATLTPKSLSHLAPRTTSTPGNQSERRAAHAQHWLPAGRAARAAPAHRRAGPPLDTRPLAASRKDDIR